MILCDTNILIKLYKNNPQIVQELRHIGPSQLVVSPVTQAELYFGALNKAELKKTLCAKIYETTLPKKLV